MITAQDILKWLASPQTIQYTQPDTLKHISDQYPYFNIGLLLHKLKSVGHINDLQLITNINPVYKSIITAQYHNSYTPITYADEKVVESNDTEYITLDETITESTNVRITEEIQNDTISEDTTETTPTALASIIEAITVQDKVENTHKTADTKEEMPIFTEEEISLDELYKQEAPIMDYFASEGVKIAYDMPEDISSLKKEKITTLNWTDENKPMVVMSFTEWLTFITKKKAKEQAEIESKSALRALWQKEKLAQAIEEESEEIPEEVFEMAVNSIAQHDEIVSETMADIYARQNKIEKAIDMYKKLSLQHPEKNAYFAEKIASLQKDI